LPFVAAPRSTLYVQLSVPPPARLAGRPEPAVAPLQSTVAFAAAYTSVTFTVLVGAPAGLVTVMVPDTLKALSVFVAVYFTEYGSKNV